MSTGQKSSPSGSGDRKFEIDTEPVLSLFSFRHLGAGDLDVHHLALVDAINDDAGSTSPRPAFMVGSPSASRRGSSTPPRRTTIWLSRSSPKSQGVSNVTPAL
jgi:hypothetical protein